MRNFTLGWVLLIAVLWANVGTAQVSMRPTPYPQVTAATATWQLRGDPVFHAGTFYYPAGPTVFFDGNVMMRTDTFQGVPVYEDATQTPFSVVYIPIGGNIVRRYERLREGELAGTVGSRTPSFPPQLDREPAPPVEPLGIVGTLTPPVDQSAVAVIPEPVQPLGAIAAVRPSSAPAAPVRSARGAKNPAILQLWIPFNGARWYSAGSAVSYSPDRFIKVGEYRGFPVYREKNRADQIYVPSVADGPLAPYKKR
jgi:hypothetical protein